MVAQVNMSCHHEHKPKAAAAGEVSYKQIFKSRALYPLLILAALQAATILYSLVKVEIPSTLDTYTVSLMVAAATLTYLAYYMVFVPGPILMLDFVCFKPDDCTQVSKKTYVEKARRSGFFTEKSLDFQEKVLALSGLGDETFAPPSTLLEPVDRSLKATHAEAQTCIFGVADEMFAQGIVCPRDVDILVVNCSMYSPVPSLAAMVVNKYKMRKDVEVFNLGGMGCSAGLIAIDLACKLLRGKRNAYALVVSTEIISAQFGYPGNQRSMMVGNCLFRTGASGVLLTNRRADRWRAKYEMQHMVRTNNGADDASYNCVHSTQDEAGNIGISLSRDLMRAAGTVLKDNITTLAPKILPWSEKLRFAIHYINNYNKPGKQQMVPNFKKAVSHFAIHPGGRAVLEGVAEKLQLDDWYMEPSKMTLHRFGNTSSSSVWYVMAYLEAKGRVKRGDKVWQIALGSGLKCNSVVWKSLRATQKGPSQNCWSAFIDKYPMEVNTTLPQPQPEKVA